LAAQALINALLGRQQIQAGGIRGEDSVAIVDNPGLHSIALTEASNIRDRHAPAPACAVQSAINSGELKRKC